VPDQPADPSADSAAEDAIAAALGGLQPGPEAAPPAGGAGALEPYSGGPAGTGGGQDGGGTPAQPAEAGPPAYTGAASMGGGDDFFVGRGSAKAASEPAAATEVDFFHTAPPRPAPDSDQLVINPGFPFGTHPDAVIAGTSRDIERHSDFEEDVVVHATALPGRAAPGSKRRMSILRRLGWGFWIALGWVVLMILVAVLAKILPISSDVASTCIPNAGPSAGHLLGCDDVGRDVLSRVIYGSQVSLVVGFASIALALLVGGTMAVIAGYLRGIVDSVFGIVTNVILAYPYLVLGLAIVTFWGHSEFQVTIFIAIVAVAPLYRIVRANTIAFAERDYVQAAIALGSTRRRVLLKQIVPDVIPTGITYGLVGVAIAVVGEGALSFLGQSVRAPTPTWGNMIAEGSQLIPSIGTTPVNLWIVLGPAIAMFLFILAINLIGDRLRAILDVREGVL
jgi:peptide/nickel transport system permease protein